MIAQIHLTSYKLVVIIFKIDINKKYNSLDGSDISDWRTQWTCIRNDFKDLFGSLIDTLNDWQCSIQSMPDSCLCGSLRIRSDSIFLRVPRALGKSEKYFATCRTPWHDRRLEHQLRKACFVNFQNLVLILELSWKIEGMAYCCRKSCLVKKFKKNGHFWIGEWISKQFCLAKQICGQTA